MSWRGIKKYLLTELPWLRLYVSKRPGLKWYCAIPAPVVKEKVSLFEIKLFDGYIDTVYDRWETTYRYKDLGKNLKGLIVNLKQIFNEELIFLEVNFRRDIPFRGRVLNQVVLVKGNEVWGYPFVSTTEPIFLSLSSWRGTYDILAARIKGGYLNIPSPKVRVHLDTLWSESASEVPQDGELLTFEDKGGV